MERNLEILGAGRATTDSCLGGDGSRIGQRRVLSREGPATPAGYVGRQNRSPQRTFENFEPEAIITCPRSRLAT